MNCIDEIKTDMEKIFNTEFKILSSIPYTLYNDYYYRISLFTNINLNRNKLFIVDVNFTSIDNKQISTTLLKLTVQSKTEILDSYYTKINEITDILVLKIKLFKELLNFMEKL